MRIIVLLFCLALISIGPTLRVHAQESPNISGTASKSAASENAAKSAPIPDSPKEQSKVESYLISIGDRLDVSVERRPELNWRGLVNSDGDINDLPFLKKSVHVLCQTELKAAEEIRAAYAELIRNPLITVRVVARSTEPAFMLGAVRTPQRFQIQRDVRLVELLFMVGGVTDRASGDIQIFSPYPVNCRVNVSESAEAKMANGSPLKVIKVLDLMTGAEGANPMIGPGDIVTVMAAAPVYLTGGVVSPQGINFRDQLTLMRAIATVGGLSSNAQSGDIRIYRRTQSATEPSLIRADYNEIKKKKQPDIALEAYDIIDVPQSSRTTRRPDWQSAAQEFLIDMNKSGSLPLRILN